MGQYAPLGITDIANLACQDVGQSPITDIDDGNSEAAQQCKASFWQTVREVGRAHNWNCLKRRQTLAQLTPPIAPNTTTSIGWPGTLPATPPAYWLTGTAYAGGALVTFGQAIYYCLQGHTSSAWFVNDETAGYWAQLYSSFYNTTPGNAGGMYEWNYGYVLPPDYLLIMELNGNDCSERRGLGSLYEIYVVMTTNPGDQSISNQLCLFCNHPTADVKYTAFIEDPTIWDPLFIGCVACLLASRISTPLRNDGGKLAAELRGRYSRELLPSAKLKDAGERKDRRYDPTKESAFLRSRTNSTNG